MTDTAARWWDVGLHPEQVNLDGRLSAEWSDSTDHVTVHADEHAGRFAA